MARTLTANAITEKAKTHGAKPVWILGVDWGGVTGVVFYAKETETIATGVTTTGKVVSFGDYETQAKPGKANQQGTVTVTIEDQDLSIKALMETQPGVQNKPAYLYLWFRGTTWPTDRLTLFGGVLTTPLEYDAHTSIWKITARGFEHYYNVDIGFLLNRQDFPEVSCSQCEGEIIPIAYGRPVYRVPACVIDRPGRAVLSQTLDFCSDNILCLNVTCLQGGFQCDEEITLTLGWPGSWEQITGFFLDEDSNCFQITSRGSTLAEGRVVGFFGSGGIQYIMIEGSDMPDYSEPPPSAQSRSGYPICLLQQDGSYVLTLVSHWKFEGDNIVILPKGDIDVVTGSAWKMGNQPSDAPQWPPGTPVWESSAPWVYAVNYLPSESVDRVEARAQVNVPGGGQASLWASYDPAHYTVNLDNRDYNTQLGRTASDPGLTTVQLAYAPTLLGFPDEGIWVTQKGITPILGAQAMTNPSDVILHLLSNRWLGNLSSTFINVDSFNSARGDISTKFAFALLDKKLINDTVTDLAHQATCQYFWDQGKANLVKIDNTLSAGDSQETYTYSNIKMASLKINEVDMKEYTARMLGKFKYAIPAPELKLARKSDAAIDAFGDKRDELQLWAYQYPTSVALATEFWLLYRLRRNRTVTFTTFLSSAHVQPGDTITLDVTDGVGSKIFNSTLARVIRILHANSGAKSGKMEEITITCEVQMFTFAIQVDVPSDTSCETGGTNSNKKVRGTVEKLYVRSDGINSMFVLSPDTGGEVAGGGDNIFSPVNDPGYDPNQGWNPGPPPTQPQPLPDPNPDPEPPFNTGSHDIDTGSIAQTGFTDTSIGTPADPGTSTPLYPPGSTLSVSGGGTVSEPVGPADCNLVFDSFTDNDGVALENHTPDRTCNGAWSRCSGTLFTDVKIWGNQARQNEQPTGPTVTAVNTEYHIDGCQSDCIVRAQVGTACYSNLGTATIGLALRASECNTNLWYLAYHSGNGGVLYLLEINAGVTIVRDQASVAAFDCDSMSEMKATLNGQTITGTFRGAEVSYDQATFNQSVSIHGIKGRQSNGSNAGITQLNRWDDFCIEDLPGESGSGASLPASGTTGGFQTTGPGTGTFCNAEDVPCGYALFEWNGSSWDLVENNCFTGCSEPAGPIGSGDFIGEHQALCCTEAP